MGDGKLASVKGSASEISDLIERSAEFNLNFSEGGLGKLELEDDSEQLRLSAYHLSYLLHQKENGLELTGRNLYLVDDANGDGDEFDLNDFINVYATSDSLLNNLGSFEASNISADSPKNERIDITLEQLSAINELRQDGVWFGTGDRTTNNLFRVIDAPAKIDEFVNNLARNDRNSNDYDLSLVNSFAIEAPSSNSEEFNPDGYELQEYRPNLSASQVKGLFGYLKANEENDAPDGVFILEDSAAAISKIFADAEANDYQLNSLYSFENSDAQSGSINLDFEGFKGLIDQGLINLAPGANSISAFSNIEIKVSGTAEEIQNLIIVFGADFEGFGDGISLNITDGKEVIVNAEQYELLDGRVNGALIVQGSGESLADVFDSAISANVKDFRVTGQAVLDDSGNQVTDDSGNALYWTDESGQFEKTTNANASIDADDAVITLTVNELGGLPKYLNSEVRLVDSDDQIERYLRSNGDYRVGFIGVDNAGRSYRDDENSSLNLSIGQLNNLLESGVKFADDLKIVLDDADTLTVNAAGVKGIPQGFQGNLVIADDGDALRSLFSDNTWNIPADAINVQLRSLDNTEAGLRLNRDQIEGLRGSYPGFSGDIQLIGDRDDVKYYVNQNIHIDPRINSIVVDELDGVLPLDTEAGRVDLSQAEYEQLKDVERYVGITLFDGEITISDASTPYVVTRGDSRLSLTLAQQSSSSAGSFEEVTIKQLLGLNLLDASSSTPDNYKFKVVDSQSAIQNFLDSGIVNDDSNSESDAPESTLDPASVSFLLNRVESLTTVQDQALVLNVAQWELLGDVKVENLIVQDNAHELFDADTFAALSADKSVDDIKVVDVDGNLTLKAEQLKFVDQRFRGDIKLLDSAAGVQAALESGLDPRVSEISVKSGKVSVSASQLVALAEIGTVTGHFVLNDTLQNIDSLVDAPLNLGETITLDLSVQQLDMLVHDHAGESFITGEATLNVSGLQQDTINKHPDVFRQMPSSLTVNVSLTPGASIELGQAWPKFFGADQGGVESITIDAGTSVKSDAALISTHMDKVAIVGHGNLTLTNFSEGQDVSSVAEDLILSVETKGGSGEFNISFSDRGLLSDVAGIKTAESSFEATLDKYPSPVFADLNGDGNLDLIVGDYDGDIWYYENQSSTGFDFKPVVDGEDIGLSLYDNEYLSDRDEGYHAAPVFADLDGDGDLDAFVGDALGDINYFENTSVRNDDGVITNLNFEAPVSAGIFGVTGMIVEGYQVAYEEQRSVIGQQPVAWTAEPAFTDLDGDGDLDLFVGSYYGGVRYFENISDANGIQFADGVDASVFGIRPEDTYIAPAFADVNNDGLVDLMIGDYYGELDLWLNDSTEGNVRFKFSEEVEDIGDYSRPTFADIDGDGDLDLVVGGEGSGENELVFIENTSTYASSEQRLTLAQLQSKKSEDNDAGGLLDESIDNLILSNPQTSIHVVSAEDIFELQKYIRPVGGAPQDAAIRVENYLSDSNADIKSLENHVARIEVVVEAQTNGSDTVLDRNMLPDQTEFVLKDTTVVLNADDAAHFKNQINDGSVDGRSTVLVTDFTNQNLLADSGEHIETNELRLVVDLSKTDISDLSGGNNVLIQADEIRFTQGSDFTLSEAQAVELKGVLAIHPETSAGGSQLLVKGYAGADLSEIFNSHVDGSNDSGEKVFITYQLDGPQDFTALADDLAIYLQDADKIDLNGHALTVTADQAVVLKDRLVNEGPEPTSLNVKDYIDQDLTLAENNLAGFGASIAVTVEAGANTDISAFESNPLVGFDDGTTLESADVIEVGGGDVFTLNVQQADELQENIVSLLPKGPEQQLLRTPNSGSSLDQWFAESSLEYTRDIADKFYEGQLPYEMYSEYIISDASGTSYIFEATSVDNALNAIKASPLYDQLGFSVDAVSVDGEQEGLLVTHKTIGDQASDAVSLDVAAWDLGIQDLIIASNGVDTFEAEFVSSPDYVYQLTSTGSDLSDPVYALFSDIASADQLVQSIQDLPGYDNFGFTLEIGNSESGSIKFEFQDADLADSSNGIYTDFNVYRVQSANEQSLDLIDNFVPAEKFGQVVVKDYDGTDLSRISAEASDELDITFQISADSQFTSTDGTLPAEVIAADVVEVLEGAKLTLTAAEADALVDKLTGAGSLEITNYSGETNIKDLSDSFADVTLLITADEAAEVSFRDIDVLDIKQGTGIQSIQLNEGAKMHADQYSGISFGDLIKHESRGADSFARVTVSGDVAIDMNDAQQYLKGIDEVKITKDGYLSIDNGSQSQFIAIDESVLAGMSAGDRLTLTITEDNEQLQVDSRSFVESSVESEVIGTTVADLIEDLRHELADHNDVMVEVRENGLLVTASPAVTYGITAEIVGPDDVTNVTQQIVSDVTLLDYQFEDLISKLDKDSDGSLNVVNVSPTTDIDDLIYNRASALKVDVTLTNGDADNLYSVDFQDAKNLSQVRNVYVQQYSELVLSFGQAVADLAGNRIPLEENDGISYLNPDLDPSIVDQYQFEFIKAAPDRSSDSGANQPPGVLRLDMSEYQDFPIPLSASIVLEDYGSEAEFDAAFAAQIESDYGVGETAESVRKQLQDVGLQGLLNRQSAEQYQLALGIPEGVEIAVDGSDLTRFHNNVQGEGTANTGSLIVTNYLGEDISGVGGSLTSIRVEVDQPNVALSSTDLLPTKNVGHVDIVINANQGDGDAPAGLVYANAVDADLSDYTIKMVGAARLAVDSQQLDQFADFSFDGAGQPTIEVLSYGVGDDLKISDEMVATAEIHAVIGGLNGSTAETVELGANSTDLAKIDVISVAAGSTLTLNAGLTELPQSIDSVHGTLIVDSKLLNNASITAESELIAGIGTQQTGNGTITVRNLLKDQDLSGISADYTLRAEVSSAEAATQATEYVPPVYEVQVFNIPVLETSGYHIRLAGDNVLPGDVVGGTGTDADGENTVEHIVSTMQARDYYESLPFTISAGENALVLTYKQPGPQAETATITWTGNTWSSVTEAVPGVAEVPASTAFEFDAAGFASVDEFEIQDAGVTIQATAAELDASHGFTVIPSADLSDSPTIEISDYTEQDLSNIAAAGLVANVTAVSAAKLDKDKLATVDRINLSASASATAESAAALGGRLYLNTNALNVRDYVAQNLSPINGDLIQVSTTKNAELISNHLYGVTNVTLGDTATATAQNTADILTIGTAIDLNGELLSVDGYTTQNLAAINTSVANSALKVQTAAGAQLDSSKLAKATVINLGADASTTGDSIVDYVDEFDSLFNIDGLQDIVNVGAHTLTINGYQEGSISALQVDVENGGRVDVITSGLANLVADDLTTATTVVLGGSATATAQNAADLADRLTISGQALTVNDYVDQSLKALSGDESHILVINTSIDTEASLDRDELALATDINVGAGNASANAVDAAALADHIKLGGNKLTVDNFISEELSAIDSAVPGSQLVVNTIADADLPEGVNSVDLTYSDLQDATEINLLGAAIANAADIDQLLSDTATTATAINLKGQTLSVVNYTGENFSAINSDLDSKLEIVTSIDGASLQSEFLVDATRIQLGVQATADGDDIVAILANKTDVVLGQNQELIINNYSSGSIAELDTTQAEKQLSQVTFSQDGTSVAQVDQLSFSGDFVAGDIVTVTIDGDSVQAAVGPDGDAVPAVLKALESHGHITASTTKVPGEVLLTAQKAGLAFTAEVATTSASGTVSSSTIEPNAFGGYAPGDEVVLTIAGDVITHTVTPLEAADLQALVDGVIATVGPRSDVELRAGASGQILIEALEAGVPYTFTASNNTGTAGAGSLSFTELNQNVFASDVKVTTSSTLAILDSDDLATATEIALGGAAQATAKDAADLADRLTISGQYLTVNDYVNQSLKALSGDDTHTLVINTSDDVDGSVAVLDREELALATSINIGAANAIADAADAAALAVSAAIDLAGNQLTVDNFISEDLSLINSMGADSQLVVNTMADDDLPEDVSSVDLTYADLQAATEINLSGSAIALASDVDKLLTGETAINLKGETLEVDGYTSQDFSGINAEIDGSQLEIITTASAALNNASFLEKATKITIGDVTSALGDEIVQILENNTEVVVDAADLTISEYTSGSIAEIVFAETAAGEVNVFTTTDVSLKADLVAADLSTAASVTLAGSASATAQNVSNILNAGTTLTLNAQALEVTEYLNQDLSAVVSGGGHTMSVATSADGYAELVASSLADATSIEIAGDPGAFGTGDAVAAILANSTSISGTKIAVNDYKNEDISLLASSLDQKVTVSAGSEGSPQLLSSAYLGDVDLLVIDGAAQTTAADIDDMHGGGIGASVIEGSGSLKITGYGAVNDGINIAGLDDALSVEVVIEASDAATLDLNFLGLESGDALTINGALTASTDDLLALLEADVAIGGSGALTLNDYTGQDLGGVIGDLAVTTNTLTASLDIAGDQTVLTAASLGDVSKITQVSVGHNEVVELSADLAAAVVDSSSGETFAARFTNENAIDGEIEVTNYGNQDLSGFASESTDVYVTSTALNVDLDPTFLEDVNGINISTGSLAVVDENDVANIAAKQLTGDGTISVTTSGDIDFSGLPSVTLSIEANFNDGNSTADSYGIGGANAEYFATTSKLSLTGDDDSLYIADKANLGSLETLVVAGKGASVTFETDALVDAGDVGEGDLVSLTQLQGSVADNESVAFEAHGVNNLVNLSGIKAVSGLEEVLIDSSVSDAVSHVRLSEALTSSAATVIEFDPDNEETDSVFFEIDESKLLYGGAEGTWAENGLESATVYGFTAVTDFANGANGDSFGLFLKGSEESMVANGLETQGIPEKISSGGTMYLDYTNIRVNLDDVSTIRGKIADSITEGFGSEDPISFTVGFFEFKPESGSVDIGVFQVKWDGGTGIPDADSENLGVMPIATLAGISTADLNTLKNDDFAAGYFISASAPTGLSSLG